MKTTQRVTSYNPQRNGMTNLTIYRYDARRGVWYYSNDDGLSWNRCDRRQAAMCRKFCA